MNVRALLAVAALAAAGSAAAAPALAASPEESSVTWSVSPATADGPDGRSWVDQKADPGETVTEHLAVRNLGKETATFALVAADGYFTGTGRFNMLQAGQESVDAGTWISAPDDVTVEPGATVVIPFTIRVPDNATPGDHAAGIAASISTLGTTDDGAQIGVNSRVGFRVMTQVTGELAPALALGDLVGDYRPSWNLFTPGELSIRYVAENAGNTQLSFGDAISGETNDRGDLLPGEKRAVTVAPVTVWPLGLISVDVVVDASVPSDDSLTVRPVTETVVVWAVPWLHLATLTLVIATIVLLVLSRRRGRARVERLLEEARAEGRAQAVSR